MAKQTFTTGQVLTAAQMTSLQQTAMGGGSATAKTASYVLVAADAGTTVAMNAAGATTITVNTGLFAAGDTVFIQNLGAGACTVTAGTATVATAGSLILPQNDAGILYFTATGAAIFYDYIQAGAVSPLTTKGDLYTFSTSDARLGVGANNTVLTADSAEATGLKWATPAGGGGMTLLSTTTLSGASTTISGIDQTYNTLMFVCFGLTPSSDSGLKFEPNGSATLGDTVYTIAEASTRSNWSITAEVIYMLGSADNTASNSNNASVFTIFNYASTAASVKNFSIASRGISGGSSIKTMAMGAGGIITSSAITSMKIGANTGNLTGTVLMYGVK